MSTTITGDASAVSNSLSRTVTAATNASPIVITTSASHLFATGDTVYVSGVLGNTAANGSWVITKISATTFSLTGSTGSGAYTSGGTAVDVSLTPQFTIPADGDNLTGASVNVALETLADRTQFLALLSTMRSKEWTADTTWTAPDNVGAVGFLIGYGGGGGGGAGIDGSTTADYEANAGGGGGSSLPSIQQVSLTGGGVYTIDIGAGGTGHSANAAGGIYRGGHGGDTTFSNSVPTVLARFAGAGGGGDGVAVVDGLTGVAYSRPGLPCASSYVYYDDATYYASATGNLFFLFARGEGLGGAGCTKQASYNSNGFPGATHSRGYAGGSGGSTGTTTGTRRGGGAGGGGAGGPGGTGGTGGNGGNSGSGGGSGSPGTAGSSAAANTGAGGGGGAGGGSSATPGTGAAGGNGGSGKLTLYYWGDPT